MSFERSMEKLRRDLAMKAEAREDVLTLCRKAVQECSAAIISLHRGKFKEADRRIAQVEHYLSLAKQASRREKELRYHGAMNQAYQEYCEARLLREYVSTRKILSPAKMRAPHEAYVLGLADFCGELRRSCLDRMRRGELENAIKDFETMEKIYDELMITLHAAPAARGLRRRCDQVRALVERTRGDITMEYRRARIEEMLEGVERSSRGEPRPADTQSP